MSQNLGDKLRELRETFDFTQGQVAYKLGISVGTLSHWELGRRKPSYDDIAKLAEFFNVTSDYLLGMTTVPDGEVYSRAEIMKHKVTVYGRIPAGVPFEAIEEILEEIEIPDRLAKKKKDLFGLKIVGTSMNKIIPDGAIGVFEKTPELSNGDIGAILVNGYDATVKKFYKLTDSTLLEPLSYDPGYEPMIIKDGSEEVHIIGKLIWYCAPLDF